MPFSFSFFKLLLLLLCLSLLTIITPCDSKQKKAAKKAKLNLPKKYKDLSDRSLYCSVCNTLLIEAETLLVDNKNAKFEYQNYGFRLDSNGKRIKNTDSNSLGEGIVYPTHTILPIIEEISKLCDKWSQTTGTESRSDGTVRMIKTDRLTGSFSGSLNLGGDSATKISSMCHDIMSKFDEDMIEVLKQNDLSSLNQFCDDQIDPFDTEKRVCDKAEFPPDIIKNINSVNKFRQKQREKHQKMKENEEDEDEDVVELKDDDKQDL